MWTCNLSNKFGHCSTRSTSDATAIESEFTTTWTTTNSDGSVETDSGIVSQLGSSLTTITTFPNDQASEYTTTWTTTNSDGSVETIPVSLGSSLTTITTFLTTKLLNTPPPGLLPIPMVLLLLTLVLSASGTLLTTLTTFAPDATSEYTTTWTTTNSDGSVETNSGVVSQSGSSLTTITTFVPDALSTPPLGPLLIPMVLLLLTLVLSASPVHH